MQLRRLGVCSFEVAFKVCNLAARTRSPVSEIAFDGNLISGMSFATLATEVFSTSNQCRRMKDFELAR
jgi:hypothetical protein